MSGTSPGKPHPSMRKATILVIEDDKDIVELVRYNLEREGFRVLDAADGEQGLAAVIRQKPDLVLLDLMLPGVDGLEVCRRIRAHDELRSTPVVILTAKGEESDVVIGLELGADDYLAKPFSPVELELRVKALLRRPRTAPAEAAPARHARAKALHRGDLKIDIERRTVSRDGDPVDLTPIEFNILKLLAFSPGGLAEMSLIALALGVDVAYVSSQHVVRIFIIVALAPWVFRLLRRTPPGPPATT